MSAPSAVTVTRSPLSLLWGEQTRRIRLGFQMKQISTTDRQLTGRMEAIGAENKLWSSQGNKDAVKVSSTMYCFTETLKWTNLCISL